MPPHYFFRWKSKMWKNININSNNIKTETFKAVLIKMPHNSKYDGYVFWHPSKLVRSGNHSAVLSIAYTEDFIFNLKKYGKGKYNSRKVIDEKEITVEDFEDAFGLINKTITAKNPYETHKPIELKAEKVAADESLIDNE